MTTTVKRMPRLSAFAQTLRDKRQKIAPDATLRDFCASRGLEASLIADMETDRRTAPGTYAALYKLAGGYGHQPTDRWTSQLLEAAIGKAPAERKPGSSARRSDRPSKERSRQRSGDGTARSSDLSRGRR